MIGTLRRARAAAPRLAAGLLLASALSLGCEIPTEVPEWETTWVVPGDRTVLSVNSLLPDEIEPGPGDGAFTLHLDPFAFGRSLGELCPDCPDSTTPVEKPAFTAAFVEVDTFPDEVASVGSRGGGITMRLTNGFSFDPLRPDDPGAARGSLHLRVLRDGEVITADTVTGEETSFPPGNELARIFGIPGGTYGDGITFEVLLDSPAHMVDSLDTTARLEVEVASASLDVTDAAIFVEGKEVAADRVEMDVEDVDDTVVDHVRGGALRLSLENPWEVGGTFELRIDSPADVVMKVFTVEPRTTTVVVDLDASEFRTFLGEPDVSLVAEGVVSGVGGPVTVEPGQLLLLDADLELVIGPKES